ncbi:hypothetical protein [Uliginosibacterium sp. 31-12]|uniref:hypothetical protein n=1 Tax=Uliginosibacterium sp. 31-12 TaxID=3062781 RepID=UPI0026E478C6|nr:hypothetical protein [Uliginosibacterium sp. 31-12]MDO6385587.1 hypothetical protein [Uliginosibacterium sp. 31-12]
MSTPEYDESLLATMTKDEREAFLEGLDDPDMQTAIADVANLSDDEVKAALAGKDDAADKNDEDNGGDGSASATAATASDDGAQPASNELPPAEPSETFRPVLRAELPANVGQIKSDLQAKQDELERKFRDGEIEFDEYKSQDRAVSNQLEQIRAAELKAHIYADQQQQTATQEWQFQVRQFMKQAKSTDCIDYNADAKLQKDLDFMIKALANDPDNAERDAEFFLAEAHKRVLALRGIAPKAAKADPAAEANRSRKPPVDSIPKTVGDLPGSSDSDDVGGGEFAHIDKLSGEKYEQALAKLTDEQRARYLAS